MELFNASARRSKSPANLLAVEESLLDYCEATDHPGFLSFWESEVYFVVLGYGKRVAEEVFEEECARLNVPIYRRCSGGGTVLQGSGCLNYTLVSPIAAAAELETITGANQYIMDRIRAAIAPCVNGKVEVQGHTDLTLNGLKFSGNAQRRKRRALLFHGSILLNFNLDFVARTLRLPKQQPGYRENREHAAFITNLRVERARIEAAIIEAWKAKRQSSTETEAEVFEGARKLAEARYSRREWNYRAEVRSGG